MFEIIMYVLVLAYLIFGISIFIMVRNDDIFRAEEMKVLKRDGRLRYYFEIALCFVLVFSTGPFLLAYAYITKNKEKK